MFRILRVVNVLALIAALVWLVSSPGWEPATTAFALLGTLLAQANLPLDPWKLHADRELFRQLQLALPPERVRFIADYDFRASFRLEWLEPLFLLRETWIGPEHTFHDERIQRVLVRFLQIAELFTTALAKFSLPEKPGVNRLPRELQQRRPHHYQILADSIHELSTALLAEYERLQTTGRDRLRISLLHPSTAIRELGTPMTGQPSPETAPASAPSPVPHMALNRPSDAESRGHSPQYHPHVDWKLLVSILGLVITTLSILLAVFVLLFGNNLCDRRVPPPYLSRLLASWCPPTIDEPSQSGLPTTPAPFSSPTPSATPEAPIRVGVLLIPDYIYTEIVRTLQDLGFEAQWVDYSSDYEVFHHFDVIYLPAGWGYEAEVFHEHSLSFEAFLEAGGGVFVERPNAKDPFVATFLPYTFTFSPVGSGAEEYPPVPLGQHTLTAALDRGDLPSAGTIIDDPDPTCQVLARSKPSNWPTLIACDETGGRVVVVASTLADSHGIVHPLSSNLVVRSIEWLARRAD